VDNLCTKVLVGVDLLINRCYFEPGCQATSS
jgi:hypothetical protein